MFETNPKNITLGANTSGADAPLRQHPLDSEENRRMHRMLVGHLAREVDRQYRNRLEMAEDEAFYNHKQWNEEDIRILEERSQPVMTFNLIHTTINWLLGAQRRQRTQFRILGRRKEGVRQAEIKTKYMKYLNDVNNTHFELSSAYAEVIKAGLSWMETGIGYSDDAELIYESFVSWRDLLWDSVASREDLADARYMFRLRWVDLDRAKALFPERQSLLEMSAERLTASGGLLDGLGDYPSDIHEASFFDTSYGLTQASRDYLPYDATFAETSTGGLGYGYRPRVRLIECWYRTPESARFVQGGEFDGELYDESSIGHWQSINAGLATVSTRPSEMMKVAVMTRLGFVSQENSPYRHNRFPFTPVWGFRDADTKLPYGIIRGLRDPQRDINKRASKLLHLISSRRVIMQKGAVEDIETFRDEVARPDSILEYKQNSPEPKIENDLQTANQNWALMSFNQQMLEHIAGVNRDNLGLETNQNKSGRAIIAHQEQGSLSTVGLTDNLSRGYMEHGRKVLSLMEQFVTEQRSIRITGERGAEYVDVNAEDDLSDNITATKADFVVAEDQFSDTLRQHNAGALLDLLQQLSSTNPEIVTAILDLVIESMDIPNHTVIVQRIREITGMDDPDSDPNAPPTPEEQQQAAVEAENAEMERRMYSAQVELAEAKAAREAAQTRKVEADLQKVLGSMTNDQVKALMDAINAAAQIVQIPAIAPAADELLAESDARAAQRGGT